MPARSMQLLTPQPAQPPQGSGPVVVVDQGGRATISGGNPAQVYEGFRHQRSELANQLERLEDQRGNISGRLQSEDLNEVDRKGLEQRLQSVDQRITATEAQLAIADANVARTAAVPGAIVETPPPEPRGPPEEVFVLSGIFIFVVLLPISIAFARRIWKRGSNAISQIPQELYDRFSRLDHSIDAIAVEVERIGEGQRYLTRLHADQLQQRDRALGAGAAERVELPVREREGQTRK